MVDHLLVLKLGGSLITNKQKPSVVLRERIDVFSRELRSFRDEWPEVDLVLGVGSGSVGHFVAHRYGLRNGAASPREFLGMCITHNKVTNLSVAIVRALLSQGLPAFTLSSASMITSTDGMAAVVNFKPVGILLSRHCIPVLQGDTICDEVAGTYVMSTEDILHEAIKSLWRRYEVVTVAYLSDVSGVLDESGRPISHLGPRDDIILRGRLGHDVTGGILSKVATARRTAQYSDAVYIVDGKLPNVLERVIRHGEVGTRIFI
jgi:isopentenyl phosphate kinase